MATGGDEPGPRGRRVEEGWKKKQFLLQDLAHPLVDSEPPPFG